MRSDREPAGQSKTRGAPRRASTALLPASLVPASRRRDFGEQEQTCRSVLLETQYASLSSYAASGASLPQRNSVPSIHIRWSTVPILRASATLLHGYANPLKRLDTSESVNLHKCLILLESCQIHATRCRGGPHSVT